MANFLNSDIWDEDGWNESSEHIKDSFVQAKLPNWCMDVIRHKHFYFQSQVEDSELPSALFHSTPILEMINYQLLKNEALEPEFVTITARAEEKKLKNIQVKLLSDEKPLDFEDILDYWIDTNIVKDMELSAVILYYLLVKHKMITDSIFFKIKEVKGIYDKETVHSLGNFQALLYFATVLNIILDENLILDMKYWSGLNIYRVIHTYGQDNFEDIVKEYGDKVLEEFKELTQKYAKFTAPKVRKEKKKRVRNRKPKNLEFTETCKEDSDSGESVKDELLDNRFALLTLNT